MKDYYDRLTSFLGRLAGRVIMALLNSPCNLNYAAIKKLSQETILCSCRKSNIYWKKNKNRIINISIKTLQNRVKATVKCRTLHYVIHFFVYFCDKLGKITSFFMEKFNLQNPLPFTHKLQKTNLHHFGCIFYGRCCHTCKKWKPTQLYIIITSFFPKLLQRTEARFKNPIK